MNCKFANKITAASILTVLILHVTHADEIPFKHVIVDDSVKDPWAKIVADIDGDRFVDIIIGGRGGPLVWYAYPNWTKATIAEAGYRTVDGEAGDIDGDGDLDIVMGGLIWYENPRPEADPGKVVWKAHKIADHPTHDVELGDLDGDGDLDIVTRDQSEFGHKAGNKIYLWRQDSTDKWAKRVVDCTHGEGITLGDIDKDGDLDVVIGGIWFENDKDIINGKWTAHKFADWHPSATVAVADINGNGRLDIVLSPSELAGNWYRLSWFEAPANPKQGNWTERAIADPIECVIHGLVVADFNGDGAMDVAASEMHQGQDPDEVAIFINRNRGTSWDKQVLSTKGSHYIRAGDIGSDGDMDLVGANWSGSYQPIELWENESKGRSTLRPVSWVHLSSTTGDIPAPDVGRQVAALIVDINQDGVNDFVIASYEKIAWFRRGHQGWTRYPVENGAQGVRIEAGGDFHDIDSDGDMDIVMGAQSKAGEIWWWENPYPKYSPDTPWKRHQVIAVGGTHHDQIFGDFDGDGKVELAFWHNAGKRLYLAEIPPDPTKPWPCTEIAHLPENKPNPEGLAKIDIDLDGKIDIVGGGFWFKHLEGTKFSAHPIDENYRFSRSAAGDLIRGGRPEVVIGSGDGVGPLNLYEWKDGKWVKRTLIEKVDHGHTLQIADINGDGHLDIYAAEMYNPGARQNCRQYVLYGDSKGNFDIQVISMGIGTHEGRLGDLDGDGDIDILQKDFQKDQRVDIWLNNGTSRALGAWWDDAHAYRVPVRVRAGGHERSDKPVEVALHFTQLLQRLDRAETLDSPSLHVIEVDGRAAQPALASRTVIAIPPGLGRHRVEVHGRKGDE